MWKDTSGCIQSKDPREDWPNMLYAYGVKTNFLLLIKDFNFFLSILSTTITSTLPNCHKCTITKTLNEKRVRAYMCVTWQTVLLTNEQSQVTLL